MPSAAQSAPGTRPRVLVTGASGFLGGYVMRELDAAAYSLVAAGRDRERLAASLTPGATPLECSLADLPDTIEDAGALDAIVHCAALSSPWGTHADFAHANVEGTASVAEAARRAGVRRIVFISSPSIYASAADRWGIREDDVDPTNRLNGYIQSKLAAEALLQRAYADGSIEELVILRPRGLVGAGDPSLVPRLLAVGDRIGVPLLAGGRAVVDLTAVENVALAVRLALETEEASGQAYNITNGDPRPFGDLVASLYRHLGEPPRTRRLHRGTVYALAGIVEAVCRVLPGYPEPPVTRYTVTTIGYSQTLDISRARAELGYEPRVSLDDALAAVAAECRVRHG